MSSYNPFKLRAQLEKHEGRESHPYTDTVGKITIGIGHNLSDNGLSEAIIGELYDEDVANALTELARVCPTWGALDDVRQRVMIDLAFNLGNRLKGFPRFLAAIANRQWEAAAHELEDSAWFVQVGQRGKDLVWMIRTGTDPVA